ncbi:MAG: DUF4340 domain-containing protein [Clostridia bacterium]|nr:DUF4340 domain-containing protein [Clostridia bacterium]
MIKKRIILISVLAALFVLMLIGYFVFVDPLLHETEEKEKIELLDGEVLGSASSILMFDQVERENIQSIEVQNSYGGYTFFYDKDKKDFFIKDYLDAPYSKEMFATLITATGFPTTMRRVTTKTENFSEYGLDEKDIPASYVLKTRDGITHKVYIGKMIPTGAGFYARYDGRDAVYIVESSISQTVLSPVTNLISAMLFLPTTQSNYFAVKDFIIAKDGKPFIKLNTETETKKDENGNEYEDFIEYKMIFPAEYSVSDNYDTLLQGFMECNGEYVVAMGKDGEMISDDVLEKYNLKEPAYEILFSHGGINNDILISEKTEDGIYYAYSLMFNIICAMSEETFAFLEWDLLNFINKPLLDLSIEEITSIRVVSNDFDETFQLYFSEGSNQTNPVTGAVSTIKDLKVKMKSTGEYVKSPQDFRYFYMGILTTNLVTYADVEDQTGLELLAKVTVVTSKGKIMEFGFYPYHTRRCFFTLNGTGEFYVLKDGVQKIVNDAIRITKGEPVDYLDKE